MPTSPAAERHGLYQEAHCLPDENPRHLRALRQTWREHCQPQGPVEALCVDTIVTCLWRLRRCQRVETALVGIHGRKAWPKTGLGFDLGDWAAFAEIGDQPEDWEVDEDDERPLAYDKEGYPLVPPSPTRPPLKGDGGLIGKTTGHVHVNRGKSGAALQPGCAEHAMCPPRSQQWHNQHRA